MASSSSSSSSSAQAKSSRPLHNFELPPLLKWNSKDGKSGGSHKRHRSMKSPPQRPHAAPASSSPLRRSSPHDSVAPPPAAPQAEPPLSDFAAPQLPRPPREPPLAVGGETKKPALDDKFDRLSLLREKALRHYHSRDWWSETDKSDVIAYRRNPLKKSAFAASSVRIGHSNSAGQVDGYLRNSFKKSAFAPSPAKLSFSSNSDHRRSDAAGEKLYRRNLFKKSAFAASPSPSRPASFFNSEEGRKSKAAVDAYKSPFRKSFFGSHSEERKSNKAAESDACLIRNPFKKSGFASPKKQADADIYPKNPLLKKSAFAFKAKQTFSSNSDDKGKIEKKAMAAEADAFASQMTQANSEYKSKNEKKVQVAEAYHASPIKKSTFASPPKACSSNAVEKKSKAAETDGGACPKINPLKKYASASCSTEKKSKAAEADAAEFKIVPKKGKEEEENPKKETDQNGGEDGDEEEIKVWNLRPRIVKSKTNKANTAVAGNNSKNKDQQQLRSGGATTPAGGKSCDREKKEKEKEKEKEKQKEKLSIAISLTKQEIEEDIFALTGAKPSRRPKKRPKNVQKQLDSVFPGLWLQSITPESYKVSENSLKG